eukprot:g5659.t1
MPPKAGRKRARESTGTAGSNKAATAASSSAPGSAPPASRRTRSNSATSEQEEGAGGGGESAPRAAKRSRRGGAADRDTDSNDDVDMGESDGPAVANGGARSAAAAGAAAKKGGRRKSASAAVANGEAGREGAPAGTRWRAVASRGKDAWMAMCDKCLPGDASAVLPAVQRLTLKFLLLLVFVLGARAIWRATLWVAGGLGTTSAGGGGGGGGGGVSRRQAALSLVAGGVASRGAPEDPEASEAAALSQLEEVKVMQEQLLALMETTSNTVEEGQEWILSAEQDLEDQSSSPSPYLSRLTADERAALVAEAEEEWKAIFEPPLEEAFLALEAVHVRVQEITAMGEAKLGAEEAADLIRLVEKAKLKAGFGGKDESGLAELVKEIADREVALKWGAGEGEGGGADSSGPDSGAQVLRTAEDAEELVAREVEIFSSGGTGMPDHACLTRGGSVVHGTARLPPPAISSAGGGGGDVEVEAQLTSPTLADTELPWADYMLHMLRVPGRVFAEEADAALSASNSLGSCFAFQGGEGRLTVKLAPSPMSSVAGGAPWSESGPSSAGAGDGGGHAGAGRMLGFVKVSHVSIEHARTALAPTVARSAPRAFRVLGWDADPTGAAATTAAAGEGLVGGAGRARARAPPRPYVLLEGSEYRAGGGALGVQTFEVSEAARELAPPVGWVTLEVQSNHGGKWTCLYGFRVHGDPAF